MGDGYLCTLDCVSLPPPTQDHNLAQRPVAAPRNNGEVLVRSVGRRRSTSSADVSHGSPSGFERRSCSRFTAPLHCMSHHAEEECDPRRSRMQSTADHSALPLFTSSERCSTTEDSVGQVAGDDVAGTVRLVHLLSLWLLRRSEHDPVAFGGSVTSFAEEEGADAMRRSYGSWVAQQVRSSSLWRGLPSIHLPSYERAEPPAPRMLRQVIRSDDRCDARFTIIQGSPKRTCASSARRRS